MAFTIDVEHVAKNDGNGPKEEKFIHEGTHVGRLCAVIETGLHVPMFKGQPARYDKGKRAGEIRDPEASFRLIFETPCEHSIPDRPLTLGEGIFDDVRIPEYVWNNPSKMTSKMKFYKIMVRMMRANPDVKPTEGLKSFLGCLFGMPVTNKPSNKDGVPPYANCKFTEIQPTTVTFGGDTFDMADKLEDHKWLNELLYFSWKSPDLETFNKLSILYRYKCYKSTDFKTSPLYALILGDEAAKKQMHEDIGIMEKSASKKEEKKEPENTEPAPGEETNLSDLGGAAAAMLANQEA